MYLIFDTETTGLPKRWDAPITETDNWPRCIQIAWQLHDEWGNLIESRDYLVKPEGFDIPYDAERIHGISTALADQQGEPLDFVLEEFNQALKKSKFIVGQNVGFDVNIMGCEFFRNEVESPMAEMPVLDTCTEVTANLCQIPGGRGGKFKLPTLTELHKHLFGEGFGEAHNATADVEATTRCFLELIRLGYFPQSELQQEEGYLSKFKKENPEPFDFIGLNHLNLKEESKKIAQLQAQSDGPETTVDVEAGLAQLKDVHFAHLHNHSQYSILQSTSEIGALVDKATEYNMPAIALTDSGNMMAAFLFVNAVLKKNKVIEAEIKAAEAAGEYCEKQVIKPIIGAELFVCKNHKDKTYKDNGYQIPFLAKNKSGYKNLSRICSQGHIDGFYYVPRVDKDLILEYKDDIIVTTGGLTGEVPGLILNVGEKQAEEALLWWKEHFGEDFYIEIVRHGLEEEDRVNAVLLKFAQKHAIKVIAANNTYYIDQTDAEGHDILLCVKEGQQKNTPIGRGRGYRYGFPNREFYFKSSDEMKKLFADLPEAILNIQEIVNKIEVYGLARDVLLPAFDIPEQFQDAQDIEDGGKRGENAYLRHLTYEGAKERYDEITPEIEERLDFELEVIANTGYPGYFLIVQDFIKEARKMGVSVGPGRGSAAGSAVAYCTTITNIDPIKYDLLFERFLNPERVSMPDIDIDFDDEGRGRVIQYVIDKYGASQVAQIITYGTMAAKSSIRDTARALDLPLSEADRLAKLVPDMKLNKMFGMSDKDLEKKLGNPELMEMARELKMVYDQDTLSGETIRQAKALEGSVRNTGIHACGVIVTPTDIREHVPVAVAKDSEMWCTQFDNSVVESAGLLKMDFLGLKTLTLIKDAVTIVKERHGIEVDPEEIPIDDTKTYELFQRGETVGVFQYESAGMQKYMRELKPTVFADLIAMNALYRPGPLEYIPNFIKRKHGEEDIVYDLDGMEEYLGETYGITVYQEQVMLLSQKLAGFTKGQADSLRKAMGKKIFAMLETLKPLFMNGGEERGHNIEKLEKVWKDWEAFASYAFNKSHSTCYAWVAYQTAYFKAHYPAEYMASVLSNNMNDIKQVTFFMEECKRMGVPVLGPDINESVYKFTVNQKGEIRFGLGAVKGVGEGAVESIVEERKKNGPYVDVFDFTSRINLRAANKRCVENLTLAGGLDCFSTIHRAQYFYKAHEKESSFLEKAIRYGLQLQNEQGSAQQSLFGGSSDVELPKPPVPSCNQWSSVYALNQEKEMVGVYISGHPLDDFKLEINNFCNSTFEELNSNFEGLKGREIAFAGIVSEAAERMSKKGNHFGILTVEDYTDAGKFFLFGDTYLKFRRFLVEGAFLYIRGKMEPKRYAKSKHDVEFKIQKIELLNDVREKLVKSVTLHVKSSLVNDDYIQKLAQVCEANEGDCYLKLVLVDEQENIFLELSSNQYRVNVSNEFINDLNVLPELEMKFN
ncbi:MAG: DNA polymerase III subunit alpha [Flavobacteriales bacterium]|nr:DNA polymerase III subunit alpha [Flavobacteriales bacterium]